MRSVIAGFRADERGATAIEYGLIAAGIAIVAIVFAIGGSLENLFTTIQYGVQKTWSNSVKFDPAYPAVFIIRINVQ